MLLVAEAAAESASEGVAEAVAEGVAEAAPEGMTDAAGHRSAGPRALVDPNALSADGTVTLDSWQPSIEGERVAYLLSSGGDEESSLWVVDAATGAIVEGPIDRTRYSPVAWLPGGDRFFYVRRLPPDLVPPGEEPYHRRLWLHRVGEDPAGDEMVFGDGLDPTSYLGVTTSDDGRWVAVTVSVGTAPRNDVWLGALHGDGSPEAPAWQPIMVGEDAKGWPAFDRRGAIWLVTDQGAPRRRACVARPEAIGAPGPGEQPLAAWREVLPSDGDGAVLEEFAWAGDALVAVRSLHGVSRVSIHDRTTGAQGGEVALPGAGSASVLGRPDEGPEVWVSYTDFATPTHVLHLDTVTHRLEREPEYGNETAAGAATIPGPPVRSTQVTYSSADGTEVRLTLVAPAADGSRPGAPRPAILYGYGGFGVADDAGLPPVDAGLGGSGRRLRGGPPAGRIGGRRGLAPRRDAATQAPRVRGLRGCRRLAGGIGLDHAGSAGDHGWVQRRSPRRRRDHPVAPTATPPRCARRRCSTWSATSGSVWGRPGTTSTAEPTTRPSWVGCSATRRTTMCVRGWRTRRCSSPSSTATPGSTPSTPARCARPCSGPPRRTPPAGRCCCAGRPTSATAPARSGGPWTWPPTSWLPGSSGRVAPPGWSGRVAPAGRDRGRGHRGRLTLMTRSGEPGRRTLVRAMSRSLIERRLTDVASRLRSAREELALLEEQLEVFNDAADDARLRSLVSETPMAHREYAEAQRHADAMDRSRRLVVAQIAELTVFPGRAAGPPCRIPRLMAPNAATAGKHRDRRSLARVPSTCFHP